MNMRDAAKGPVRGQRNVQTSCLRRVDLPTAIAVALATVAIAAILPSVVDAQRRAAQGHRSVVEIRLRDEVQTKSSARGLSTYDNQVLSQRPVMFLSMDTPSSGSQRDATGHGHSGTYLPRSSKPRLARMPNGDAVAVFNGRSQYLEVPDSPALSVPATGVLTVQCWIRPDTLQFPTQEGTGYCNFVGKSTHGEGRSEYELRMYSKINTESPVRPNRISAYCFNLSGACGSGSYFQDRVKVGEWIMATEVINTAVSAKYPTGYVRIYKNGSLRGTVALNQYNVTPQHGGAPFRVAVLAPPGYSYFMGAIGKVAVFDYELSAAQVAAQYAAMTR